MKEEIFFGGTFGEGETSKPGLQYGQTNDVATTVSNKRYTNYYILKGNTLDEAMPLAFKKIRRISHQNVGRNTKQHRNLVIINNRGRINFWSLSKTLNLWN